MGRAPVLRLGDVMADQPEPSRPVGKTAAATGSVGKPTPAAKPVKKPAVKKTAPVARRKSPAGEAPATDQVPPNAATAAQGATMAKAAEPKTATKIGSAAESKATKAVPKTARSAAETEKIRAALAARRDELREEYDSTIAEINELQRDRLTDSAGDDQADTGTKTFEREQEISLANNILERITQVERALERLDEGSYGWCERCGNPIPVERLAAFPSATLCVTCKQLEERR